MVNKEKKEKAKKGRKENTPEPIMQKRTGTRKKIGVMKNSMVNKEKNNMNGKNTMVRKEKNNMTGNNTMVKKEKKNGMQKKLVLMMNSLSNQNKDKAILHRTTKQTNTLWKKSKDLGNPFY